MVAQAPSGKAPLPEMMTSIRLSKSGEVEIVDQLLLPHEVHWLKIATPEQAFEAIKSMKIRGAPAIASLAALSLRSHLSQPALAPFQTVSEARDHLLPLCDYLQSSRPTAVNLGEAMDRVRVLLVRHHNGESGDTGVSGAVTPQGVVDEVKALCLRVFEEDLARCREMGRIGAEWLWRKRASTGPSSTSSGAGEGRAKTGLKVITVCNTGSLATSGYGTAIGVITSLFETSHLDTAYYAQTTPYHQGSRLTSLELTTLQVPACMICDTMLGSLMQHEDIDGVIVGADRIVANGDTANKIGTYQAAVLAQRHNVPFMVVAPVATVDLSLQTGDEIHIEHRPAIEATLVRGRNVQTGELSVVRITPEGVGEGKERWQQVYNPSFDVTPAQLISCIVTEKGVAERIEGQTSIDVASIC